MTTKSKPSGSKQPIQANLNKVDTGKKKKNQHTDL